MQVFWNAQLIGSISDPKVDSFFVHGRWVQSCSEEFWQRMLEALVSAGEVRVEITRQADPALQGALLTEPDVDGIEIRLSPPKLGPGIELTFLFDNTMGPRPAAMH